MLPHVQRLAASCCSADAPELVLIHGWGMSSAVWAKWLPLLRPHCNISLLDLPGYGASASLPLAADSIEQRIDTLLDACLKVLPAKAVYLGYSLGGMVATQLAARFPQRVTALITLASNARFVADERWPWAMPEVTFAQFYDSVAKPALALKRFAGLQVHGSADDKSLLKEIRAVQEQISEPVLRETLQWLKHIDNRAELAELSVPALFCFAENDALVPSVVARQFPRDNVLVVEGAPHALFLSDPQVCADAVLSFMKASGLLQDSHAASAARKKLDVARSFSKAAATYDSVAELQRQVGDSLLKKIPPAVGASGQAVIDLGCGTGYFKAALKQRFPGVDIVGIDLAEGMVRFAARHQKGGLWICGDAENLPLAENSVAVMFSSLAIQWCENTDALFAEIYRVLSPGGQLVFSTLGPDTLYELREAWESVDDYTHVNGFLPWQCLRESITAAGFSCPNDPQSEQVVLEYNTLKELTVELKSLGAHNVNRGRPAGLTTKQRMAQLLAAYEQRRNERGFLPASYQVWYGVLTKPLE